MEPSVRTGQRKFLHVLEIKFDWERTILQLNEVAHVLVLLRFVETNNVIGKVTEKLATCQVVDCKRIALLALRCMGKDEHGTVVSHTHSYQLLHDFSSFSSLLRIDTEIGKVIYDYHLYIQFQCHSLYLRKNHALVGNIVHLGIIDASVVERIRKLLVGISQSQLLLRKLKVDIKHPLSLFSQVNSYLHGEDCFTHTWTAKENRSLLFHQNMGTKFLWWIHPQSFHPVVIERRHIEKARLVLLLNSPWSKSLSLFLGFSLLLSFLSHEFIQFLFRINVNHTVLLS